MSVIPSSTSVLPRLLRWSTPLVFACGLLHAPDARADGEAWLWVENRLPLVPADAPTFPRLDLRLFSDVRLNGRAGGVSQAFLRGGPLLYVTPWMFVALQATVYADRLSDGRFDQEARGELEPNLFGRVGDFTVNDRNRFEYRWRENGSRTRYRNQLRVSYAPIGAAWIPFVWDEVLFDLTSTGFQQNRAQVGIGRMLSDSTRFDVGYMLRSRKEPGDWVHDHIVNLYLFFDVPKRKPKPADGPNDVPVPTPAPALAPLDVPSDGGS